MKRSKLPSYIAASFLFFAIAGCSDKDKKDDPTPAPTPGNNTGNTPAPCTTLDINKFTGKKWYKVGSNGTSWIEFAWQDSSWIGQNVPYPVNAQYGKWVRRGGCEFDIKSRKYNSQTSYSEAIQTLDVGMLTDTDLEIISGINRTITKFKTTP